MNLGQLRAEVEGHGFDDSVYGTRINSYLNDAQQKACRRVGFYTDEATDAFQTVSGTSTYAWPADLARLRSLIDTGRALKIRSVLLDDIDRSAPSNGAPTVYADDGTNVHLYPTPDNVYSLSLRYWRLPAVMSADGDVPVIPDAWQDMLVYWALKRCYASEDDLQNASVWEQQFNTQLSMFAADVKFPDSGMPSQVRGMWDDDAVLARWGW